MATDLTSKIHSKLAWAEEMEYFGYAVEQSLLSGVRAVLDIHKPDPDFAPPEGVCRSCGGTGEVYGGTGADGHIWTGEKCCCDHPHCLHCGECWEGDGCPAHRQLTETIAKALGVTE